MDPQIEELKQLVRQSVAISQENNKMLHKMRNAARWSAIARIVWWLTVIGVTGAIYYYYLGPYVEQFMQLYQSAQHALQQAQQFGR